jgi:hypothetical protein
VIIFVYFSLHQHTTYTIQIIHSQKIVTIGTGYFDSNAFYDPDYNYNQDVVRNAARMRQNQKQTQQLPQNPQQQQMQMQQQQKMMGGPNGPKPMDNKTMGNMQQMQNLPGQQNKQNQMVIIAFSNFFRLYWEETLIHTV